MYVVWGVICANSSPALVSAVNAPLRSPPLRASRAIAPPLFLTTHTLFLTVNSKNAEIGHSLLFRVLTPKLVTKVLNYSGEFHSLINKDKNMGKFLFTFRRPSFNP